MPRQHGIQSDTYTKFVIDSGAVYLNYGEGGETLLGATRGGNTLNIETEYREMEVDGAKGPVKGSRRITRVDASITANFIEISAAVLGYALPGSSTADYPVAPATKTHDSITRAVAIALADYQTNIAILGEVTGGGANANVLILSNTLADSNFEYAFADKDETVLTVTWKAHFDPSDLDTEPWELRFPVIA